VSVRALPAALARAGTGGVPHRSGSGRRRRAAPGPRPGQSTPMGPRPAPCRAQRGAAAARADLGGTGRADRLHPESADQSAHGAHGRYGPHDARDPVAAQTEQQRARPGRPKRDAQPLRRPAIIGQCRHNYVDLVDHRGPRNQGSSSARSRPPAFANCTPSCCTSYPSQVTDRKMRRHRRYSRRRKAEGGLTALNSRRRAPRPSSSPAQRLLLNLIG